MPISAARTNPACSQLPIQKLALEEWLSATLPTPPPHPAPHLPEPQLYPSGPQKRSHKQLHKAQVGILNKGLMLVPETLALEECLVGDRELAIISFSVLYLRKTVTRLIYGLDF